MILLGETEAGTAGTQPCRGIARWAHRDDERGREDSSLRRPKPHRIERPHALKIPARRAEYSLTENVASPFHAELAQHDHELPSRAATVFASPGKKRGGRIRYYFVPAVVVHVLQPP